MAVRALSDMLGGIERALAADMARRDSADRSKADAIAIGSALPLVHRTGPPKQPVSWKTIVAERVFRARAPGTARERALGIERAVYFFLGCGAYPEGIVGFVLDASEVLTRPGSFTPFDSGGLEQFSVPSDPALAAAWDDASKAAFLEEHLGSAGDALDFAGPYLASHFRDPIDYVRRGQTSDPDYPTHHGLKSPNGDRRAWTIEIQVHGDVPFGASGAPLHDLVVGRQALLSDLPDDLIGLARVATAENEVLETIAEQIVATCEAKRKP